MKNLMVLALIVFGVSFANSQAFTGSGDSKLQIGANLQNLGTGINVSYDLGLGENISVGLSSSYLLGIAGSLENDITIPDGEGGVIVIEEKADFLDRIDVRARFNANLGNVINVDENLDVYPGLSLGLKNFGGHLGARYFFSDGFGLYSEFNIPFAKYNTDVLTPAEELHNQFTVNVGLVFNI